uniref:Uncharacterized protein n=1 Tax=Arundo donax TaxID=35708 RepID=A0A0A8ZNS9_ARUDO
MVESPAPPFQAPLQGSPSPFRSTDAHVGLPRPG